ncbi:uncharacterized protein HHUB_1201 [Halobacterium hubeiense]|uniref:Uncharacterized protein n=1 Tax=Halobacterium hubeiense TaxID=1407499 RepID=A0A0U5H0S9_9EURY|nr:uncharacterized protein HHUB_1201 [Halobacterium hubeiense]
MIGRVAWKIRQLVVLTDLRQDLLLVAAFYRTVDAATDES